MLNKIIKDNKTKIITIHIDIFCRNSLKFFCFLMKLGNINKRTPNK